MKRILVIELTADDTDDEPIVERVLDLINKGYTSGFEPSWSINEVIEPQPKK